MNRSSGTSIRHGRAHPGRTWRAVLGAVTLLAAGTATIVAAAPETEPSAGSPPAVGSPERRLSDPPDGIVRDADQSRGQDDAREAALDPLVPATVHGPEVNGRRQPAAVSSPQHGDGEYLVVSGGARPPEGMTGSVARYVVEVERGLPFDPEEFAADVHTILNDERGWGYDGSVRFRRVDSGRVDLRVALSSPDLTDDECYPLLTRGRVSCWNGTRAVINAERWGTGSQTFDGDILSYREYLINHEVGHGLGHGHVNCPEDGALAPIMVQQTKSLEGCEPNPWPSR